MGGGVDCRRCSTNLGGVGFIDRHEGCALTIYGSLKRCCV